MDRDPLIDRMMELMDREEIARIGWPAETSSIKSESDVFDAADAYELPALLNKAGFHEELTINQIDDLFTFLKDNDIDEMVSY